MKPDRLEEIRGRVQSCSPGPWRWVHCYENEDADGIKSLRAERLDAHGDEVERSVGVPTAEDFQTILWADPCTDLTGRDAGEIRFRREEGELISHARDDLDYLLRLVDGLLQSKGKPVEAAG